MLDPRDPQVQGRVAGDPPPCSSGDPTPVINAVLRLDPALARLVLQWGLVLLGLAALRVMSC